MMQSQRHPHAERITREFSQWVEAANEGRQMKRTKYVSAYTARSLVESAAEELREREYPPHQGSYFKLAGLANDTDTDGRARIAAACYLAGGLTGTRALDNCFENNDGARVSGQLARMAETDPTLYAAIARDFGGEFPAKWIENARNLDRPSEEERQLLHLAAKAPLRSKGKPVEDAGHLPLFIAGNEPGLF